MIRFFFRKKYPNTFSIENLFEALISKLKDLVEDPEAFQETELEEYNNSFSTIIKNIFSAKKKERSINHITGDVYSIVLGFKSPSILTIHDCNPLLRYSKWHYRYWVYRILQFELPMLKAKYVTVISKKTKAELLRLTNCSEKKIKVIPNFVDPLFVPGTKLFNESCPRILHIGTNENKNLSRLIETLAGKSCELRIIGKPTAENLKRLEVLNINYSFAFNLNKEDVVREYQSADILAFVSTYEGFGLPIIEANACQIPVLTSDLNPMSEVAGNAACLVDPFDIEAIQRGLEKIFSNENYRKQLIENGIENVKRYNLDTIANNYLDLYQEILKEQGKSKIKIKSNEKKLAAV